MTRRSRTAVVHLVRHANRTEAFDAFLAAYGRFDAGLEHELVLLFKGFPDPRDTAPYLQRAADTSPLALHVPDTGFDLMAYRAAARMLPHERVCFLNSFSELRAPGWLGLLDEALGDRGVGAAGATGSWGSHLSYSLWQLGLSAGYGEAFESRHATRRSLHELSGATSRGDALHWLFSLGMAALNLPTMSLFPSVHLRTNAFLMDRELFCSLRLGHLRTKRSTYRMESGRGSMTAQLKARGCRCVVVDRHGRGRDAPDWHAGDVFWQGGQEDLLVSDNQTRTYDSATPQQRQALSRYAWGTRARPR